MSEGWGKPVEIAYLEGEKSVLRLGLVDRWRDDPERKAIVEAWKLLYGPGQLVAFVVNTPLPHHTRQKLKFSVHEGNDLWPKFKASGLSLLANMEVPRGS